MPIIQLPEDPRSNAACKRGANAWIKSVTAVDRTQTDGYAFTGSFVSLGRRVEVPWGTWYLMYVDSRDGNGGISHREITLYRVTADGLATVCTWRLDGAPGWALAVRDGVADIMAAAKDGDAPSPAPDVDSVHPGYRLVLVVDDGLRRLAPHVLERAVRMLAVAAVAGARQGQRSGMLREEDRVLGSWAIERSEYAEPDK